MLGEGPVKSPPAAFLPVLSVRLGRERPVPPRVPVGQSLQVEGQKQAQIPLNPTF